MDYKEALKYLDSLEVFGIKLGLERIRRLLAILGMPQESYPVAHVTGTNGKGSVSAMLADMISGSGCRTGLYTSPHLLSYRERMQIDRQPISEQDFALCMEKVKTAAEKMARGGDEYPTQFEVLTALAFLYFSMEKVDYAVIEVGLGGLLDSTNVVVPTVSVITNVAFEHADRCGGTLEGVAKHKAGIVKAGVPVVTAANGMPLQIIRDTAKKNNCEIIVFGQDFDAGCIGCDGMLQKIEFESFYGEKWSAVYDLSLLGTYQTANSAVALQALYILKQNDSRIKMETALNALGRTEWPCRFEVMQAGNQKIVIDGAHNPAGMTALRKSLDFYFPEEKRLFLLGILKDKDIEKMIEILLRRTDGVVVTQPQSERAEMPEALGKRLADNCLAVEKDPRLALEKALRLADGKGLLCITGSLYLVGMIRGLLGEYAPVKAPVVPEDGRGIRRFDTTPDGKEKGLHFSDRKCCEGGDEAEPQRS